MILHTLVLVFLCATCAHSAVDNIAVKWSDFQLSMMRTAQPAQINFAFSRAARLDVIVATSMYDTWTLYQPLHSAQPYIASNTLKLSVWPKNHPDLDMAISFAAYRALSGVMGVLPGTGPGYQLLIDQFFASLGYNKDYTQQSLYNEAGVGNFVAALVLQNRTTDGFNSDGSHPNGNGQVYSDTTGWIPRNDPFPQVGVANCATVRSLNHWQPARVLKPDGTQAVQTMNPSNANMAIAVTFSMVDVAEFRPPPPPLLGRLDENILQNSIDDMLQVFSQLGDDDKVVANFWQNGPNNKGNDEYNVQIAIDAARAAELPLEDSVKLLFSNAWTLWDVFITQFDGKLFYDPPRPTTIIQCVRANQEIMSWQGPYLGVGLVNSSQWTAYFDKATVQNPSPEYPCGHCLTCGSVFENLRLFFGTDTYVGKPSYFQGAGTLPLEPKIVAGHPGYIAGVTDVPNSGPTTQGYAPATDVTINWPTFTAAENSCGRARVKLGVHFNHSFQISRPQGNMVARKVFEKCKSLWNNRWGTGNVVN